MSVTGPPLTAPDPRSLAAVTVALPPVRAAAGKGPAAGAREPDPLALAMASTDGFVLLGHRGSVCGFGAAARLVLPGGLRPTTAPAVTRWLAGVPADDPLRRPASGALAVGALPFLPGEPAELLVPAVTVVTTATGLRWATIAGTEAAVDRAVAHAAPTGTLAGLLDGATLAGLLDGATLAGLLDGATLAGPVDRTALSGPVDGTAPAGPAGERAARDALPPVVVTVQSPDGPEFERRVAAALAAVTAGRVDKVVLARQVRATFAGAVDPVPVLRRLLAEEPTCAVFAHRRGGEVFLGASPELLVRRRGARVVSHPLAGTSAADDDAVAALVASPKEQAEHRAVAAAVARRLATWCEVVDVPDAPSPVRLRGVAHLGTRVAGVLRAAPADALTLVGALHPTPAVAGVPTDEALALIGELEEDGRGLYAGPVGWADARGDGEWLVAIRSATVAGDRAVAYGGAGIVDGSVPERELAETAAKLHTALGALGADAPARSPA